MGLRARLVLAGGMTALGSTALFLVAGMPAGASPLPGANGRIVFASSRDTPGNVEIYVMNADGSSQTRLTNNSAFDGTPSWSPDGTKIAFTSTRPDNNGAAIYVMNADGSGVTKLTDGTFPAIFPAWSPDGRKIAYSDLANGSICVMSPDGSGQTCPATGTRPAWSPDGSRIVFETPGGELALINADGSGETPLSNLYPGEDPAWSPDGTKIAYDAFVNGDFQIRTMNIDGSADTSLTNDPSHDDEEPAWSPDGTKIAFERDGNIVVMNADGSGTPVQLTSTGTDFDADWQSTAIYNVAPNPATLWSPNHQLVPITVNYNVLGPPSPACALSVASNEPLNGTGDGDTSPDWIVIDAHHVQLRAERARTGTGRVYTITVACTDSNARLSTALTTVSVPVSQS